MKISKKTDTELILEEKIGLNPFLFIWSLFFTGIPLFIGISIFSTLGITTINCQRIEPTLVNCDVFSTGFGGFSLRYSHSLNNVISVEFQQIEDTNSDNETTINNQVILSGKNEEKLTIEETIFINNVKGDAKTMREISTKINNFLNSNESYFTTKIDNRWRWSNLFIFCFISLFLIMGCAVCIPSVLAVGYWTIIFDKASDRLKYTRVNLLGKKEENFTINAIPYILIKELKDSDGDSYFLLFIPVSNYLEKYQIDRTFKLDKIEPKAQEIANFLNKKVIKK